MIALLVLVIGLSGYLVSKTIGSQSSVQQNSNNVLDLSSKSIDTVDSSIYGQTSVTELILSNNNLKTLPSQMGQMVNLKTLKLDHNQLQGSLIAEIRKMPLESLDVSNNNMTGVPAEVGQLTKLKTLNYSYNQISALPNEIVNIKNNLLTLILTGNPFTNEDILKIKAELPNTNVIF